MNVFKANDNLGSIKTSVIFRKMAFLLNVLEKITSIYEVSNKI